MKTIVQAVKQRIRMRSSSVTDSQTYPTPHGLAYALTEPAVDRTNDQDIWYDIRMLLLMAVPAVARNFPSTRRPFAQIRRIHIASVSVVPERTWSWN